MLQTLRTYIKRVAFSQDVPFISSKHLHTPPDACQRDIGLESLDTPTHSKGDCVYFINLRARGTFNEGQNQNFELMVNKNKDKIICF